jgi:uncharacterized protein (DUF1015 family)
MPFVRPFRALKYHQPVAGDIGTLTAPPYDIIFDEWRDRLYERSPYNIVRLIRTRDVPLPGEEPDKYCRAAVDLDSWIAKGVIRMDDRPSIYVCSDTFEHEGKSLTRWGFIALVRVEEFGKGIHPHERTLSGPKVDRLNLVKATRTNLSQVFGVYRDPGGEVMRRIEEVTSSPAEIAFVDEMGVERKMWPVTDTEFVRFVTEFMKDHDIIIADGHHRYETALAYRDFMEPTRVTADEPFDYVSMYLSSMDDRGMLILPTHRKAGGMDGFTPEGFFRSIGGEFTVEYPIDTDLTGLLALIRKGSESTSVFGVYTGGAFGVIRLANPATPKDLDVEVLHDVIIERTLGITRDDIAAGRYLQFSKSPEHVVEEVDSGRNQIGFLLNPVRPEEMFPRVLRGNRLPQKSTYFYPKTVSGLVMYRIERSSLDE